MIFEESVYRLNKGVEFCFVQNPVICMYRNEHTEMTPETVSKSMDFSFQDLKIFFQTTIWYILKRPRDAQLGGRGLPPSPNVARMELFAPSPNNRDLGAKYSAPKAPLKTLWQIFEKYSLKCNKSRFMGFEKILRIPLVNLQNTALKGGICFYSTG